MREKLIDLAHDYFDSVPWYADIADLNPEELIDHLIANGVTIPVRCKDCKKRYKPNECPMCILVYGEQHDFTQENGYCDRGERRTDD